MKFRTFTTSLTEGRIASDLAKKLLERKTAEIEFDSVSGVRDRKSGYHGRLLAYI